MTRVLVLDPVYIVKSNWLVAHAAISDFGHTVEPYPLISTSENFLSLIALVARYCGRDMRAGERSCLSR